MNELYTPPGYVEYPRDRRFLPLDNIGRFELVAKGYLTARLSLLVAAPLLEIWTLYGAGRPVLALFISIGASFIFATGVTFGLRKGLAAVLRADGKRTDYATLIAAAVGGLGFVLSCGFVPVVWSLVGFALPVVALCFYLLRSIDARFREFGLARPPIWTRNEVDRIVAELRRAEEPVIDVSRDLDEVGKLELMTQGANDLKWAASFTLPLVLLWLAYPSSPRSFLLLTIIGSLLIWNVVATWTGLSRFYRGKGLHVGWASAVALAFGMLGAGLTLGQVPLAADAVMCILQIVMWSQVRASVDQEFRKFGRRMPSRMDRFQFKMYFRELRLSQAEKLGPSIDRP